jgi:hypothetical protein
MDLMGMLGGVLQQVEGGQTPAGLPQHMDNAASMIPPGALGDVLSHIFNSSSTPEAASAAGTPPFSQMIGGLFGQSSAGTQASVLNSLISSAGPALLGSIMGSGGLSNLAGVLGGSTPRPLSPDEAAQIPPEEVEKLAHHVQQQNPGIMDEMSQIYSAHPTLIKTLGTGAMMLAMRKISQMQQQS